MDTKLIQKNGAEAGLPKYKIIGPAIDFTNPIELHIKSHPSQLKVSALIWKN
jgi:hypothetical protein